MMTLRTTVLMLSAFVCGSLQTIHSTTAKPGWEGTTDIPEEIEVGEDVTTNSSIPTTPPANDPMEQNDFYNPTRKPQQKIMTTTGGTSKLTTTIKPTTNESKQQTTAEAEEYEVEETTQGEAVVGNIPTKNAGSCPPLQDAIVEHHVILRHGDCEIVISQDDSIRWFNEPGKSSPSVFVRSTGA